MIGVIADDLTGAAEIGAIGLRHGLRAEIVRSGRPGNGAQLVCVDTDSRSCQASEAARRAAAAAQLLRAAGAEWIYKKVDSVLRGHVTAEVEAVMSQLQLNRAILLPANPSLGRIIRDGRYFVRGKPLHKTEFARDPEYPRRVAEVTRLLKLPEKFSLRLSNGDFAASDGAITIAAAATAEDVRAWATCCQANVLAAGGAEFFDALLAAGAGAAPVNHPPPVMEMPAEANRAEGAVSGRRELFVCGTSTEAARRFAAAARRRKTPVFSLPRELMWGAAFSVPAQETLARRIIAALADHPRVLLNVGLPSVREAGVARQLSDYVVQLAERVLRQTPVGRVFAEGGATAAALVRRMGWARLMVLQEHAPGVATLAVDGAEAVWLTIKPGSYAWPAQWTDRCAI